MLAIERSAARPGHLPVLARVGLLWLALGLLADVVAHLEAAGHVGDLHVHSPAQASAHLIVFAGMVLILLGVVVDGARQTRSGRPAEGTSKGVA